MTTGLVVIVVGLPIGVHLLLAGVVFVDARDVGMPPRKWMLVALALPLFGVFWYLFERSERNYDPASDPYRGGGYNLHERGRDDDTAVTDDIDGD